MEQITVNVKEGLNLALNEAEIVGLDFIQDRQIVCITFWPVAIERDNSIPVDNRYLFVFRNVGRLACSLTLEKGAKAIEFDPNQLPIKIAEYQNESIYGWEFIDNEGALFSEWQDNKSFDLVLSHKFEEQHTIDLFQEDRHSSKSIDLRIWFDTIEIFDTTLKQIAIEEFIANGKRGWSRLYQTGWKTNNERRDKLALPEEKM